MTIAVEDLDFAQIAAREKRRDRGVSVKFVFAVFVSAIWVVPFYYLATSIFGVAAPSNILLVYRRGDPTCQPVCRIPVNSCLTGNLQAIRALAYDECKETIYISDGRQTSEQRVIWPAGAACPTLRRTRAKEWMLRMPARSSSPVFIDSVIASWVGR